MAEPLKNSFDRAFVERIADAGVQADASFDRAGFVVAVLAELEALELKDRISLVADQIVAALGGDYADALPAVLDMAPIVAGVTDGSQAWGESMEAWPLCSVVERHGLVDVEASLAAMAQLTRAFSCEFAIRPFLAEHLDRTLAECHSWATSPIPAVRRLASEGTRPYLPWGQGVKALIADPELGISILTTLRHDPDEVVRRSVANHLNDVARHAPDRVADIATEWMADPDIEPAMVRHALRGLVKKGHPGAMAALGYATEAAVEVGAFSVTPGEIRLGESIELTADITSTSDGDQKLVVDFVIHHVNANGETSPKVFKWTTIDLAAGEQRTLTKKRKIATASTRRYHAGVHRVDLQIAGTVVADDAFDLLESS
ncbi:MAG: DNA alkylation repair protein [Actinomycetota bacterium]